MKRLAIVAVLSIATAFQASGCMWGVVRDANTGAPVWGATVSYTDSQGGTATTTTGSNGIYVFDQASRPVPAAGAVGFTVTALGYGTVTAARLVDYRNNPNASLDTLSSFWDTQHLNLEPSRPGVTATVLECVGPEGVVSPTTNGTIKATLKAGSGEPLPDREILWSAGYFFVVVPAPSLTDEAGTAVGAYMVPWDLGAEWDDFVAATFPGDASHAASGCLVEVHAQSPGLPVPPR